jgi:hypothetical protein
MRHRFARVAFVKHRGHEHDAVHAEFLHVSRVAARLGGAALGDAAQHFHATVHGLDHRFDDEAFFSSEQRLVFAERAEENNSVHAGLDQNFCVRRRRIEVERLVFFQLRGDGGKNAAPERFAHFSVLIINGSSKLQFHPPQSEFWPSNQAGRFR